MLAQQSVHLDCTIASSSGTDAESEDIGVAGGRITSNEGGVSISNILLDGVAYLSTNTAGVLTAQGIPQTEAEKLANGEWISIKPGQSYGHVYLDYANAILGMTLTDQANTLRVTGSLKRTGATWAQGVSVYGVSGTGTSTYAGTGGSETVYIAATGAPLPVSVTGHSNTGSATTCNLSGWNEPVKLTVPANVVPITAIPT